MEVDVTRPLVRSVSKAFVATFPLFFIEGAVLAWGFGGNRLWLAGVLVGFGLGQLLAMTRKYVGL